MLFRSPHTPPRRQAVVSELAFPRPRAPPRHPPVLALHPFPPSSISRPSRRPRDPHTTAVLGRPLDIQPSSSPIPPCCCRGPISGLPPLPHLLLSGLHLWAPAATGPAAIGPAAAGDPSPSSWAPLEASRRHALSAIQVDSSSTNDI